MAAKKALKYNEAIAEIESVIEKIEHQDLDVDELTNQVKRVSELIKFCKDKLYKTESEVQKILDEMEGGEG